ncbi:related to lactonohydrolase [Rhynchosporium agropyri]|uniref:Related to lactonohydrolase n=1 Tax=Rhynchosporium agropyri TaxID=914238 RepID=A0A1E1L1D7_9HELO|nr:related to lactonohydrolase [Rhynchosporium agropyri]
MASAFATHSPSFSTILGPSPTLKLLLSRKPHPFAHGAGVFFPDNNTLFITSSPYIEPLKNNTLCVQINKISLDGSGNGPTWEEIPSDDLPMASGGVNYKDGILFCSQGSNCTIPIKEGEKGHIPSGLYHMQRHAPYTVTPILTSFHGRKFDSVSDLVVHPTDGSIWFTDPTHGQVQGLEEKMDFPSQVYRYDPMTGNVRAMADGFATPNGICFGPGEEPKLVYVTVTKRDRVDEEIEGAGKASIYVFDIQYYSDQPFLVNRRLFAHAAEGFPNGIECDMDGNVYSGCGDGVAVWCPGGVLLGVIKVNGGAANFCFGKEGAMYILNETRLWKAQLSKDVEGALLGI